MKAVAHVRIAERRLREKGAARAIPHAVVLTRMPAAIRPRALRTILLELTALRDRSAISEDAQLASTLAARGVSILPTAMEEKEA